jgi:DNA-binding CsgD family transcriptional regulator
MKTALRRKPDALIEEPADLDLLTPRQRDILRLVSVGHTNREIANMLQISVRTVEVHRFNLMRRLNVRNVAQLLNSDCCPNPSASNLKLLDNLTALTHPTQLRRDALFPKLRAHIASMLAPLPSLLRPLADRSVSALRGGRVETQGLLSSSS